MNELPGIYGRWFRKGRNRFVLRTRRWVPFDRRHHAKPPGDWHSLAAGGRSVMRSAYRLRSKRRRGER